MSQKVYTRAKPETEIIAASKVNDVVQQRPFNILVSNGTGEPKRPQKEEKIKVHPVHLSVSYTHSLITYEKPQMHQER